MGDDKPAIDGIGDLFGDNVTPKSLAMRKMEKNFVAVMEKGYTRKPWKGQTLYFLLNRAADELIELRESVNSGDVENALWECADVSNLIDFIFERLQRGGKLERRLK